MSMQEGWHPDPDDDQRLRYWDGSAWTGERVWDGRSWVEAVPAGDDPPTATSGAAAPAPGTSARPRASVPPTAPPPAPSAPGRSGRVSPVLVAVLAVVAALLAGGITFLLVGDDGDEGATADTVAREPDDDVDENEGSSGTGDTDLAAAEDREAMSSSSTSTTTSTSAGSSGDEHVDQWIAVLASTPVAEGDAAAGQRLAELRAVAPGAAQILSDDFASLNPGFYVTYVPGFATGDAAVAYCTRIGLAVPSQCYGRFLSNDPADKALQAGT